MDVSGGCCYGSRDDEEDGRRLTAAAMIEVLRSS